MSFAGITLDKLLIIGLLAVLLLGPERLPAFAERLASLVRGLRQLADGAKDRMRDEMGPEFDEVDWRRLDPRQYDPRRIVMQALNEPEPPVAAAAPRGQAPPAAATGSALAGTVMRFDEEAT